MNLMNIMMNTEARYKRAQNIQKREREVQKSYKIPFTQSSKTGTLISKLVLTLVGGSSDRKRASRMPAMLFLQLAYGYTGVCSVKNILNQTFDFLCISLWCILI